MTSKFAPISAIHSSDGAAIDQVLQATTSKLVDGGYIIRGFLQGKSAELQGCCSGVELQSISDGLRFPVMQALGKGARGCRLDPGALTEAADFLIGRLEEGADMLILNRFGKGESLGGGMRSAIEYAFSEGIPVVIGVRDEYLQAFREFTGREHQEFSPTEPLFFDLLDSGNAPSKCRDAPAMNWSTNFRTGGAQVIAKPFRSSGA